MTGKGEALLKKILKTVRFNLDRFLPFPTEGRCRWHYVLGLSVHQVVRTTFRSRDISRTVWGMNFKLGHSMYHHWKTIWLNFSVYFSVYVKFQRSERSVQIFQVWAWLTVSEEPFEVWTSKHDASMYHQRKIIWIDFGVGRSKVVQVQTLRFSPG